ncbi:MAG TPA: alpha-ketoacid dehydrogenase subunit beta [Fimbriimonadaceae bacterium]|nr:alpha-ketoacid dehydrogenase subunit beta [Fimbriimonadaceae bacterium]
MTEVTYEARQAEGASTRQLSFAEAIREALAEELERDEAVFLMGEDIGAFGGVFGVTSGLHARFGSRRVVDTPISETFIVGGAVGAAITGLRPVVELQFADFAAVAMDELALKAAAWRYMHGGLFDVPLVVRMPEGAIGGAGPEQSQCPEGLFSNVPGLHVVVPSTPADAKGLLKSAIRSDDPVLFFEHKVLYKQRGPIPDGEHLVPIGVADVKRQGDDVTIVAWARMVQLALDAAERLVADGVSVEVVDPRGLRPLDQDTIISSVKKTGRAVIVHEASRVGGPGAEVAAVLAEHALPWLAAPIVRVGAEDVPLPQSAHLEQFVIPNVDDVIAAVRRVMGHA